MSELDFLNYIKRMMQGNIDKATNEDNGNIYDRLSDYVLDEADVFELIMIRIEHLKKQTQS